MRRAERALEHQALARAQRARRAVDARHLQRLLERHVRQNARQAARHHRLAAARRADHQHVVPARCGDFQRALGAPLAAHVGKVIRRHMRTHHLRVGHGLFRLDGPRAAQTVDRLLQMRNRQDLHALHAGGLLRVVRGQQQPADAAAPRRNRHGERAAHADHAARQRELAHRGGAVQRLGVQHAAGCQNRQRDGQVVGRALLFDVRRGEVDCQAGHRERQAAGGHRRAHALAALLHGGVRQADDLKHRQPVRAERLDRHAIALDARKAHALYAGQHMLSPSFVFPFDHCHGT